MGIKFSKEDTLAIKGVAILFLLQYHNFYPLDKFEKYKVSFYPFTMESVVPFTKFLKICVAMFAFLSAYGLTLSLKKYSSDNCLNGRQYSNYLKNRLPKLMWGYWFVVLFSVLLCAVIKPGRLFLYFEEDGIRGTVIGVFYFIADFLGLASLMNTPTLCGTWWYMSLAIFVVMIVPFIARVSKRYGFLCVTLMCVFIPRVIINPDKFSVGQDNNLIRWLFTAVLGVAFAQNDLLARMKGAKVVKNKIGNKVIKFVLATFILVISYLAYIYLNDKASNFTYEIRDGLIPVFVIYYFYEFIIDIPVIRNVLVFIGKHSMNIFLFSSFIRGIFFADFTYSFVNWLRIDLVLLVTSLIASIVIELIKKYSGYNKLLDVVMVKINTGN